MEDIYLGSTIFVTKRGPHKTVRGHQLRFNNELSVMNQHFYICFIRLIKAPFRQMFIESVNLSIQVDTGIKDSFTSFGQTIVVNALIIFLIPMILRYR